MLNYSFVTNYQITILHLFDYTMHGLIIAQLQFASKYYSAKNFSCTDPRTAAGQNPVWFCGGAAKTWNTCAPASIGWHRASVAAATPCTGSMGFPEAKAPFASVRC